ncbi:MAG TPA: alpha/beta fold hydrolase, partial [Burkholderiaceae bacterium]
MFKKFICVAVALGAMLAATSSQAAEAGAKSISAEAFFAPLDVEDMFLSPSGRFIGAVTGKKGERKKLVVIDTTDKEPTQIIAVFDSVDVSDVHWMTDEVLVFSLNDTVNVDAITKGTGLLSVRRNGSERKMLIKRDWDNRMSNIGAAALDPQFFLLSYGPRGGTRVIIGEYVSGGELGQVVPYWLDVSTRARQSVLEGDPPHKHVYSWLFDDAGRPRVATGHENGDVIYFYADATGKSWRQIGRFPSYKADFTPAFVDGDRLFVRTANATSGQLEIREFDLASGKIVDEPLITTLGFDASAQRIVDAKGRTAGYRLLVEEHTSYWISPAMRKLQAEVDKMLPGRVNRLSCSDCFEPDSVLVYSYADRFPGEFLHVSAKTGKWQRFGEVQPAIDTAGLGRTGLIRIKARDGLEIPVWVTRPVGVGDKPLPTVVLAHGGPWVRGRVWGWSAEAQFLAARGYVVIEPEFRGSEGYGTRLYQAGWKQWGLAMQDDLADALQAAIAKGWSDPKRVCIAGASYGGYAALMGVA